MSVGCLLDICPDKLIFSACKKAEGASVDEDGRVIAVTLASRQVMSILLEV